MKSPAPQRFDCNEYCYHFGCQNATTCPARAERIERAIKAGMRKTTSQRIALAVKIILQSVAFTMLSLAAVLMMCAAVVMILEGSKP